MDFCFAFRSTDARLLAPALEPFAEVLTLEDGAPSGWGMGYYQSGQPLLRKEPRAPSGPLEIRAKAKNLRTDLLLGQRRSRPMGPQATRNTHPFRFRNWIFCHCGQIEGLDAIKEELLSAIPDFIRRNIRGVTDSEHLFHLFLAFLNDTGKLDDPRIPGEVVGRALASTIKYLDRMAQRESDHCCVVTNGRVLVASHRGIPVHVARHSTYKAVARTADDKPISYPHLKTVMLVAGREPQAPGWESVAEDAVVVIDDELNIDYTTPGDL